MMEYIKSKITGFSIFMCTPLLLLLPIFLKFIYIILSDIFFSENNKIAGFFILLLVVLFFLLGLNVIKHMKYIIIKNNKLRYFSLFRPWGRILDFNDYIGKTVTYETGSAGSYKVVYLVDKFNRTTVKLMGIYYKNFEEIDAAIPLPIIKFTPTVGQYFRLLFFERITIPEKKPKTGKIDKAKEKEKEKQKEKRFQIVFMILKIIGLVGISLFVVGSIIQMVLRLLK